MDESYLLQILIGEFRNKLTLVKGLVPREVHFPDATNKIKVAVGMRRVGKTYFLYQQVLELLNRGVQLSSILYINFEDDRLMPWTEQRLAKLVDAFYSLYPENHDKKCYLFFDEIQNVRQWPLVIRRLHDSKNAEIFLTGSSAKLLSKEISTSLRGRSLSLEIWPYSFSEFLKAGGRNIDRTLFDNKTRDNLRQQFDLYLSNGGFPETTAYNADARQQTLQEYLDVLIYRDIIERHNIKNPTVIKYMILSMLHNIGKPFAINKLYNDLKTQGYPISKDSLYEYMDHIEDTYLAFSVETFDKSIRKARTKPKKLYAIDPGLVRAFTLDYEQDLGRLFENIVFLDLKRLGCSVSYYTTAEGYEIDFLAQAPRGQKKFFQVAWEMNHETTKERETRALEAGMTEMRIKGEIITLNSYLQKGVSL